MRKIFINGRFFSHRVTGVERYSRELLNALDHLLENATAGVEVEVLVPSSVTDAPVYRHLKVTRVGRLSGHAWEQIELPRYASGGVLFTPAGGAPLLFRRNVITIHDAGTFAFPLGYSWKFIAWYRFMYRVLSARGALHFDRSHSSRNPRS